MSSKWILITLLGLGCAATATYADDEKKSGSKPEDGKIGKFDRARVFEKLDADANGKLSKDEFKKMGELLRERLKSQGKGEKLEKIGDRLGDQLVDRLFAKFDGNGDGSISKDEFEKAELPNLGERIRKKKSDF